MILESGRISLQLRAKGGDLRVQVRQVVIVIACSEDPFLMARTTYSMGRQHVICDVIGAASKTERPCMLHADFLFIATHSRFALSPIGQPRWLDFLRLISMMAGPCYFLQLFSTVRHMVFRLDQNVRNCYQNPEINSCSEYGVTSSGENSALR